MHQQHPPRSNYGAANDDVMAAIAAAMATEEQTAATEAIQKRQQHAPSSSPIPQPFPVRPKTGQVEVPTPARPTAFPQPPAMTQPQVVPPQPVASPLAPAVAPQPAASLNSFVAPAPFPSPQALESPTIATGLPELETANLKRTNRNGLAISLSLVATVCLAVGGAYVWHTNANSPATVENPPAPIVPIPDSTPLEPLDTGDNTIAIPVNTVPGR